MDDTMIRCLKRIDENFGTLDQNQQGLWKAIKKNARKIRGVKGVLFGFGIGMLVLAAELAERKRSQNYLQEEIDNLKERYDKLEDDFRCENGDDISGGVCDA